MLQRFLLQYARSSASLANLELSRNRSRLSNAEASKQRISHHDRKQKRGLSTPARGYMMKTSLDLSVKIGRGKRDPRVRNRSVFWWRSVDSR